MNTIVHANTPEENRFETISEFKWCVECGGDIEFIWNVKIYDIVHDPDAIVIYEAYSDKESYYKTADELLEHLIDGDRLRDMVTHMEVTDRTI